MKSVIIGAGKTGRGFIAPILLNNNHEITFIDKDTTLVQRLKEQGSYKVNYYNGAKTKEISGYQVYTSQQAEAIQALEEADLIFTSVFASNIKDLIPLFKQASKKLNIICCENGVDVVKPLIESGLSASIGQGIVFCTTMNIDSSLNLISESYPNIPIDNSENQFDFDVQNLILMKDFSSLIERKIYTYNYFSAIIAYVGDYLGYTIYGEAANDELVIKMIDKIIGDYTQIIAEKYQITYDEQLEFSYMALTKFRNKNIVDTIERNATQVKRKLSNNERIMVPFSLMNGYHKNTDSFIILIACAIHYAIKHSEDSEESLLQFVSNEISDQEFLLKLKECCRKMLENINLLEIVKDLNLNIL